MSLSCNLSASFLWLVCDEFEQSCRIAPWRLRNVTYGAEQRGALDLVDQVLHRITLTILSMLAALNEVNRLLNRWRNVTVRVSEEGGKP